MGPLALKQQSSITFYRLPTKENKLPFPANKRKLPFSVSPVLRISAENGSSRDFPESVNRWLIVQTEVCRPFAIGLNRHLPKHTALQQYSDRRRREEKSKA
jgi:hypothetical protein